MTTPRNVEFDRYASECTNLHRASLRASGEEPAFFPAVKAKYMAAWLGSHASAPLDILDFGCGIGNSIMPLHTALPAYIVFFPKPLASRRPLEPLLGWLPLGAQYVVHALA